MFIKFYSPSKNLGCPGISLGKWFYADLWESWGSRGMYVRINSRKYWIRWGCARIRRKFF